MSALEYPQPAALTTAAALSGSLRLDLEPPRLIDVLPTAAYACDAVGRILWFNRRAAEMWGQEPRIGDPEELYCGSHKLYFDGKLISRDQTPMAHALRTGETIDGVEGIVERPDGSQIWVMVHISPIRDHRSNVIGAVNCFHDTTDKHRLDTTLKQKTEELEDFFENAAVPLHIVSGEGIILRANKAELGLLGYREDEYIGRPIRDIHADAEIISDILSRLTCGEKLERVPARLRARDGSIRHVLITSTPRFKDGRFVNTRCLTVDVTEEFEARRRAQDTEERYRQILEALPVAVYTTNAEGTITYYNKAAVEMSGRTPELGKEKWCVTWRLRDAAGQPLAHEDCPMAIALKENRPVRNVEAMAERPDGTLVPFIPHPTPLRDGAGNLVGAVNVLVDVAERKHAEHRQITLLKELNHRVKNNMQMLYALVRASQRETQDPQARSILMDATRRIGAMAAAQQVLYAEGAPAEFDVKDFVQAVCAAAQSTLDKQITITIAEATGTLVNDHAMPLALVLNELLTNAAKYGARPGEASTVEVGLTERDGAHLLWVKDNGPGFRLDASVQRRASGLGLVSGLARQLGGRFRVESDNGATCIVEFNAHGGEQ